MSEGKRGDCDFHLGLALVVGGCLFICFRFLGVGVLRWMWPVAMIALGWQMYRRARRDEKSEGAERSE